MFTDNSIPAALWFASAPHLLLDFALKATVLLAGAAIAELALRRASASTRHAVWATATAAVLALPLFMTVLPRWEVPGPALPSIVAPRPNVAAQEARPMDVVTRSGEALSEASPAARAPELAPAGAASPSPRAPVAPRFDGLRFAMLLWLTVAMAIAATLALGHVALRRLARRAQPFADPEWSSDLAVACEQLSLRRPVRLLCSPRATMPMTFGLAHPCILMPASSQAWSRERRRVVLLHELAHIQRFDCLTQSLAQLACAALWFHPLIWYAASRLRVERERACDDLVLKSDTRPSDYAEHLLEVARTFRPPAFALPGAVAFARPSQLEGRLLAVLDSARRRGVANRGLVLRLAALTALVLLPLAALEPWAKAAASHTYTKSTDADGPAIGEASVVLHAPEAADFESRWSWAKSEAARRGFRSGYWVGYAIGHSGDNGILNDSEGLDLSMLSDDWKGPKLDAALGAAGEATNDAVAILLHLDATGTLDHVRVQNFQLASAFHRQPVLWLGTADDAASIARLDALGSTTRGEPLRRTLLGAVATHESDARVVPVLLRVLDSDRSEEMRSEAAEGLGRHPSPATRQRLLALAKADRSTQVRRNAVDALGRFHDPETRRELLTLARTSAMDSDVRRAAIEALGREATEEAVGAMDEVLEAPPAHSEAVSPQAAPEFAYEAAHEHAAKVKVKADRARASVDEEVAGRDEGEIQVRRGAIESLSRFPEGIAVPRLRRVLEHSEEPELRRAALEALGRFDSPTARELIEHVLEHDADEQMRRAAVEQLARDENDQMVQQRLRELARTHRDAAVRVEAIDQLTRRTPEQSAAVLDEVLARDDDERVQRAAVDALGRLDESLGIPRLKRVARAHPNPQLRRAAIEELGRKDPNQVLEFLDSLLQSSPSQSRR